MSLAAYLAEQSNMWDRIVAKYGLRPLSLRELVGHDDQHADFAFTYGAPEGPRAFVSTIKLRQAGFTEAIDTEDEFRNALQFTHRPQLPAARDDLTSAKVLPVGRPPTRCIHLRVVKSWLLTCQLAPWSRQGRGSDAGWTGSA
jgi:hypothetical protein